MIGCVVKDIKNCTPLDNRKRTLSELSLRVSIFFLFYLSLSLSNTLHRHLDSADDDNETTHAQA